MAEFKTSLLRNALVAIVIAGFAIGIATYASNNLSNPGLTSHSGSSNSSSSISSYSSSITSSSSSSQTTTSSSTSTSINSVTSSSVSSAKSQSTVASTTSASSGGLNLVSYNDNVYNSIYDSVNHYIYALNSTSQSEGGSNQQTQLIIASNGTIITLASPEGFVPLGLGFNSSSGIAFELGVEGAIGCSPSILATYSGTNMTGTNNMAGYWEPSGPFFYDSQYNYLAFAVAGGLTPTGICPVGVMLWVNNTPVFVQTGPQPRNFSQPNAPHYYSPEPALAYNTNNGDIYVPILNDSTTTEDATYLYTVRGYSALPTNYTLPGQTQSLLFDSSNQYLYAEQLFSSNNSTSLLVINPSSGSIIGTISLSGNSPMVYDSSNQMVYVFEKNQILELSGTQVVHTYQEPTSQPSSVVYDSGNNELVDFYTSSPSSSASNSIEMPTIQLFAIQMAYFVLSLSTIVVSVLGVRAFPIHRIHRIFVTRNCPINNN
jgi:hypothetical protein